MAKIDEVLSQIKMLDAKLYGENGFEGDIPEIKSTFREHGKKIRRLEMILASIAGTGVLGGSALGLINWLG